MPVQHADAVDRADRRRLALLRQSHLVPAELLLLAGIDARRKHRGESLAAETDADRRHALLDCGFDGGELLLEKRIAVDFVNADRATEHDDEIGVPRRAQIVDAGFERA
jgi:hypothetical protein